MHAREGERQSNAAEQQPTISGPRKKSYVPEHDQRRHENHDVAAHAETQRGRSRRGSSRQRPGRPAADQRTITARVDTSLERIAAAANDGDDAQAAQTTITAICSLAFWRPWRMDHGCEIGGEGRASASCQVTTATSQRHRQAALRPMLMRWPRRGTMAFSRHPLKLRSPAWASLCALRTRRFASGTRVLIGRGPAVSTLEWVVTLPPNCALVCSA